MRDAVWIAGAHCPGCGSDLAPGATECATCGFELVDARGREFGRPSRRVVLAAAGLVAALALTALIAILIASREPLPEPVPAAAAERRLEARLSSFQDDDTAAVACPGEIAPGEPTRCRVRYGLGGVQPIDVRLTQDGELDVDIP